MSGQEIKPEYIPDQFLAPVEDQIERSKQAIAERKAKLTPLQGLFVNHFFECNMDVSLAASRTGVKVSTARGWVETEGTPVSELIGSRLAEMAEQSKVTVATIVQALWDEANRMPVDTDDKTVSHAARVAALAHLAKYKGMFDKGAGRTDRKISVNINVGGDAEISGGEVDD